MSISFSVISIGTLSRNRFWNESQPKRAAHSTTTLVRDGVTTVLVDPGLPPELMAHRLDERTGLHPEQIEAVFLTTFRPVHRRSLSLFSKAKWFMHEPEIEAMRDHLNQLADREEAASGDLARLVREERALLDRVEPSPERLSGGVHLFPSPGFTPGSACLLLPLPSRTVIVAGDAVVTQDYYEAGRVFEQVADLERAQESFAEVVEIADEIVPGHDNVFRVAGR